MSRIDNIRDGLADLASIVQTVANTETPEPVQATVNSLSGNAIHGGKITLFRSTGITDKATKNSLLVTNDMITVGKADIDSIVGDLQVEGTLTVDRMEVEELVSTQKFNNSIDFHPNNGSLDLIGLQWRQEGQSTKQIIWREDRFFISNTVDLHRNASIQIDNIPVLSANQLGVTVTQSNLETVGTLQNLRTTGDVTIDDFIMYESGTMRLGIGSEAPNAQLSVASNEAEFIVDPDFDHIKIGSYTTSDLSLVTDNKERITIKQHGDISIKTKVGINVEYVTEDVDLAVRGPIRIQDKKISVGSNMPSSGQYNLGDIVYNSAPVAGGKVGWICIQGGSPGTWKAFGAIDE